MNDKRKKDKDHKENIEFFAIGFVVFLVVLAYNIFS